MDTNTTDSTFLQNASGSSPEHSDRGNRHNNDRRTRGRRPYHNYKRSTPARGGQSSRGDTVTSRTSNLTISNENQSSLSPNATICFICADPVNYFAVSECNHKICHLCSLRLRALYGNKNCAYCKTEQIKVIFTREHDKEFQDFEESDIPFFDENLNAYCEDQEMFDDITLLLKYNCPNTKCAESYEGWSDLKRHIKRDHRLSLCDICIRHKKIFAHEHSLFTHEDLDKHFREGDEGTGFKGHPKCQFCKRSFYGDDELYEHCRDKHEQCFICVRSGTRHNYYRDYDSLEEHFMDKHHPCQNRVCLEKKFVVFDTDIDLKAHEVSVHGTSFSGQRAKHEARMIGSIYANSYADTHSRGGRRRSRERQPERRTDDDVTRTLVSEITRQTQNINIDSTTSTFNDMIVNARAIRPPPGFGILSPEEVIESADETLENEMELHKEDFPTLSESMGVNTSNNSGTIKHYSEKVKQSKSVDKHKHKRVDKPKPADKHKSADKPIQSIASSSRSESPLYSYQQARAFPPLIQSTSTSSISSITSPLNYREKAILSNNNESELLSRNQHFHQRVSALLSNNPAKLEDFKSVTKAYNNSILDASSYIEELLTMFNKRTDVGKVVSGLAEILEDEKKRTELLREWQDYKAKKNAFTDFPALEPIYSYSLTSNNNSKSNNTPPPSNKPSPRVLVIKSSTTRSGGAKASSGPRIWDKIAAIAESKIKEKDNSDFPSLTTAASSSNNDVWKGSVPNFVQSPSRSESTSSVSNSPAITNTSSSKTTFVRDRSTKSENEGLPLTPKSSNPQQKSISNGSEINAWGHNKNENDSEDDSSYNESTKEGVKKKKQKKQKTKTVIFHHGQKNIY